MLSNVEQSSQKSFFMLSFVYLLIGIQLSHGGINSINFLILSYANQDELVASFEEGLVQSELNYPDVSSIQITKRLIIIDSTVDVRKFGQICNGNESFSIIVDFTRCCLLNIEQIATLNGLPYIRIDGTIQHFVQAVEALTQKRGVKDAAYIFETSFEREEGYKFLIKHSNIRFIAFNTKDRTVFNHLAKVSPLPQQYALIGSYEMIKKSYREATAKRLTHRNTEWIFMPTDWSTKPFSRALLKSKSIIFRMDQNTCCILMNKQNGNCDCSSDRNAPETFVKNVANLLVKAYHSLEYADGETSYPIDCNVSSNNSSMGRHMKNARSSALPFSQVMRQLIASSTYKFTKEVDEQQSTRLDLGYDIKFLATSKNSSSSSDETVGYWQTGGDDTFSMAPSFKFDVPRAFYKIGTMPAPGWAMYQYDNEGKLLLDKYGSPIMFGYCIDVIHEIAARLDVDYEIVVATDGSEDIGYLQEDGTWNGLMGDLINGGVDIVIAGAPMSSEKEIYIDFVSPYFSESGISVLGRQRIKPKDLFKFAQVLKPEVWACWVVSVFVSAIMLWFVDYVSPFSGRNNRKKYRQDVRVFTIQESLWCSINTFTTQGGGENPKSFSGKILIACYWLYIMIMLSAFTANLAAFLTVERMQKPIRGIEGLGKQADVNYTVQANSTYLKFFEAMAIAETDLYELWKRHTLIDVDVTNDDFKYRVWDYPVKEMFTHLYRIVKAVGPIRSPKDAFQQVLDKIDGSFAFIHDAMQVRYLYNTNCDYLELGNEFGQQPYAIALPQGSQLYDNISYELIKLHKKHYFDRLIYRYWNNSYRRTCSVQDDSEGISLHSMGGVFIITGIGILFSIFFLAKETWSKNKKNNVITVNVSEVPNKTEIF